MLMKKGVVNQKSLYTRRTIIYSFFSSLDQHEFPLFLNELLLPLNLSLESSASPKLMEKQLS